MTYVRAKEYRRHHKSHDTRTVVEITIHDSHESSEKFMATYAKDIFHMAGGLVRIDVAGQTIDTWVVVVRRRSADAK